MQFKALNLQHPGGSRVRWYKNKPQQTSVRTGTEQSSAALSTQDNPVHFQPTLCIYRQLSSLALIKKKKNLEGEFVAESWIAQCCKQLWKFTPFLQKITHQNHFHQHFFCILPLFSLQSTYSFVLPSAVRCTFTSPSLSFKQGLEIYSETLKPTWLLM